MNHQDLRSAVRAMKKASIFLAAGIVLASLAGCTSPSGDTPPVFSDREPKNLEARILIDMGELHFADSAGVTGATFHVPAGKVVGIHVRNTGQIEHEIMFGRAVNEEGGAPDGYHESLFESVDADLFVFRPEKMEIETEGGLAEVELEPGADVWIRATFPDDAKGTWEIGCFVSGHYEGGMKATLIIE